MQHSRLKQSAIRSGVVALGLLVLAVLALDVEISFLHVVGEQKCTWVLPGTGVVLPAWQQRRGAHSPIQSPRYGAFARVCPWGHGLGSWPLLLDRSGLSRPCRSGTWSRHSVPDGWHRRDDRGSIIRPG